MLYDKMMEHILFMPTLKQKYEQKRKLLGKCRCRKFFASLKKERGFGKTYENRTQARFDITDYIGLGFTS